MERTSLSRKGPRNATQKIFPTLACIVCRKQMTREEFYANGNEDNVPAAGLEFRSAFDSGTRLWPDKGVYVAKSPAPSGALVINVCDQCIAVASQEGLVAEEIPPRRRAATRKLKVWRHRG